MMTSPLIPEVNPLKVPPLFVNIQCYDNEQATPRVAFFITTGK